MPEGTQATGGGAAPATAGPLVADLLRRHFPASGRELVIGGIAARTLAATYGTPLYAYDLSILRATFRGLRAILPPGVHLSYSVKANPNQALLRELLALGAGLEIASRGELVQALDAGCAPADIVFAGPGKTDAELDAAVAAGVGEIHVESLGEGRRLAAIAATAGRRVAVALRVNPSAEVEGGSLRMGGRAVAFGIDEEQVPAVAAALAAEPALDVRGLHLFMGTQILEADVLLRQYRAGLDIARHLAGLLGRPLATLDLGGGLGVPYFPQDGRLDLERLGQGLAALRAESAADPALAGARWMLEPGRFLVAECGVYLVRVTDVKRSRGKTFAVTDGGMHHHLAASGNLGQTLRRNFPLAAATRLRDAEAGSVEVVGPLCTPLDVLGRGVALPALEPGDLLAVFQSGAYARAASPLNFLSREAPAEVVVDGGQARLVRRAGVARDYLVDQSAAEP